MTLYKLPLGIKIPNDNQYPKDYDVEAINKKRNLANIVEGFTIKEVSDQKFSHYIEMNIDSDRIWNIFCVLIENLIGDNSYGILGFKDEEPILSKFADTENIIEIFQEYKFELTNDGYLEFGIAYYDENSFNEIFVSSFKYIKIWTNKKETLIKALNGFGIKEVKNLQFIDEFPVISEAISNNISKSVRHYLEVIEGIERKFEDL
ncbi:hypothetical protein UT300007_28320 [Clostridium sp. CTA-7]